ncbi:MAG: HlyD family efflux transporter periplasmic adaptor subunit [Ktedonobacteraceae bacterium]
MRRMILVPVLIVLAVLAIIGGISYYVYNSYMYYSTDDAQVNGQIVNISAPGNGQLTTLTVKQGDKVTAGQTIGTVNVAGTGANAQGTTLNITSPIAGTVVQVPAVQGQGVAAGLTVAQITDPNNINVIAYVDENTINNVSNGQQVDVTVDAYKGTTYTGHVQQIVQATAGSFSLLPTQDNASGNFTKVGQRVPVIVNLNGNGGNDLVPGLSAEVTIHLH